MTTISTTSGYATFINVFTCEPENQERLVETLMQETTEVVSGLPGFVSANLHRSLDGRTVVNYAQWTDLGAFRALMAGPQGSELRQRVHGLATGVAINLYEVDRVLGNGGGRSPSTDLAFSLWTRAWHAIEGDRMDELGELFSADAELQTSSASGSGVEYVQRVFSRHRESYPDLRHEVVSVIGDPGGQSVAVEMVFSGTHCGTLRHPGGGEIPPTGRRLTWKATDHVRVADGRIVSWHAYFDRLAMLQQLTAPAPAQDPARP